VIESVSPRSGLAEGGGEVVVTGAHFGEDPFLTLGVNPVVEVLAVSDTEIRFVAPPGALGPAALTVARPDGRRGTRLNAWFYLPAGPRWYPARYFQGADDPGDANVLVVPEGASVPGVAILMTEQGGGGISGEVLVPGGDAPASNVLVWASRPDNLVLPLATVSDLDGHFRLDGLPPGDWRVYTQVDRETGYANVLHPGVVQLGAAELVSVTAGMETTGVTLPLQEGGAIEGTVTGEGGVLTGPGVFASMVGNSFVFGNDFTDESGAYRIPGLPDGAYSVLAFGQSVDHATEYFDGAFTLGDATPVDVVAGESTVVDFELAPGATISGTVLETSTLAPLGGVQILAEETTTGAVLVTSTNAQGEYTLEPLPPGEWRVQATDLYQFYGGAPLDNPGGATLTTLLAGQDVANRNFSGRLGSNAPCGDPGGTATVQGDVLTDAAVPLVGVRIQVITDPGGALYPRETKSATDGSYSLDCLPPDSYFIRATLPGSTYMREYNGGVYLQSDATSEALSAAQVLDVPFSLSVGSTLSGTAEDADTHATLSGLILEVEHLETGTTAVTTTGVDGTWTVTRGSAGGLRPGTYRIRIRDHLKTDFNPYTYY
jgi:hypothetical protein